MLDAVISLICVSALLLGSPGPVPLALAATGATSGFKNGIPFLCGVMAGIVVAVIGAALGLGALFTLYPNIKLTVQIIGALYILYIAVKIATASTLDVNDTKSDHNIPCFYDGLILNSLNPKAYAAFLVIFSQFLLSFANNIIGYVITGLICLLVAAIVDFIWLGLGDVLRPLFEKPKSARIMRISFAVLMLIAVGGIFIY
ncbi:MAG: LysE family translocator [bacterium]|nr:LysE family translocator [bacterium]